MSGDGHRFEWKDATMRCGKCGLSGDTITTAQVKACFTGESNAHPDHKFIDSGMHEVKDDVMNPPSDAQVKYLVALMSERVLPAGMEPRTEAEMWLMEKADVSSYISALAKAQKKTSGKAQTTYPDVPEGRYALDMEEEGWWFFQVDKPTEGRWEGYTFVKRLIGAPGDYRKINLAAASRKEVMRLIEKDPERAMKDYGLQSRHCGICGSSLSNDESVKRGMGPYCAAKLGW